MDAEYCLNTAMKHYKDLQMEIGITAEEKHNLYDLLFMSCTGIGIGVGAAAKAAEYDSTEQTPSTLKDPRVLISTLCAWRTLACQHTPTLYKQPVDITQFHRLWKHTKQTLRAFYSDNPQNVHDMFKTVNGALSLEQALSFLPQELGPSQLQEQYTGSRKECTRLKDIQSSLLKSLGLKSLLDQNEEEEEKKVRRTCF